MSSNLDKIAEDVDQFVKETTEDTESIAVSVKLISQVATVVGAATVVFLGVKIIKAVFTR